MVLRRIEHLQQGRRGIAPEIGADLVEFIQQDDRVAAFDPAEGLDDPPGQRADISPPVPADFRLVAHAAQGDAGKLAAEGIRHALAEGSLARARRAYQTEDRPFEFFAMFDDRDELKQPLLDLGQSVMLFVENPFSGGQVYFILRDLGPRQGENPIEVMAGHGVFGRGRRDLLQPFEFLLGHLAGFGGQRGFFQLLAQRPQFAAAAFPFAQLALDRAQLFPEKIIPLRFGNGRGHFRLDFRTEREDLLLAIEQGQQGIEPLLDRGGFEQFLPFGEVQVEVDRHQVAEVSGVFGVQRGNLHLIGEGRRKLDDLLELALGVAQQGGGFHRGLLHVAQQLIAGDQVRDLPGVLGDFDAPEPFNQHPDRVVRKLEHLQDAHRAAHLVEFFGGGIFHLRFALQNRAEQTVAPHRVVNELNAAGRFHEQRRHHVGEYDNIRQPEHGEGVRQGTGGDARRGPRVVGRAQNTDKFRVRRIHRRHRGIGRYPREKVQRLIAF
ncbi:MAG: hypothetical protein BWX84_02267 [Verrucomicrobia bacterium ADurb.Bin118]|nr:MAG: hypothetical protein BWX84_02267 [Verrucomicrobia bacterium ADurb.Bin118]